MIPRRTAATHGGAAVAGLALGLALGGGKTAAPVSEPTALTATAPRASEPLPSGCSCFSLTGPPKESIVPAVCDDGTKVQLRFSDPGTAKRAKTRGCYIVQRAGELGDTVNPEALFVLREVGP